MASRTGLHALELAGCMFQDDVMFQPGVLEPFPLVKRLLVWKSLTHAH